MSDKTLHKELISHHSKNTFPQFTIPFLPQSITCNHKPSGRKIEARLHFAELTHLDQILTLQQIIVDSLANAESFEADSKEFIESHLSQRGRILAVFAENRCVAYRTIEFYTKEDHHHSLGLDINLPANQIPYTAHLETVAVHPEFRGNGLSFRLNQYAVHLLEQAGYFHICATVHPTNFHNIHTLLRTGLVIRRLKKKYQGKLRFVCHQNLRTPVRLHRSQSTFIKVHDQEKQLELLNQCWIGHQIQGSPEEFEIRFSPLENSITGDFLVNP